MSIGAHILAYLKAFAQRYSPGDPRYEVFVETTKHALWFLAPSTKFEYYASLMEGGADVPWSDWIVPLVSQSIFFLINALFTAFLAGLCYYSFVVIEKLPFPLQLPIAANIDVVTGVDTDKLIKRRWLLIGFIIGFLIEFPHLYPYLNPASRLSPIRVMKGFSRYFASWMPLVATFDIFAIAFSALLPVDISFTGIVTYLIFYIILPAIFTSMGLYPPPRTGRDWMAIWRRQLKSGLLPEKYGSYSVFFTGVVFGLAFWTLYMHRDYIRTIFASLLSKETVKTIKEHEGFSLRSLTIGAIITGIALICFWIILGIDLGMALFYILFYVMLYLGLTRWKADSGAILGRVNVGNSFTEAIGSQYILATGGDMKSTRSIIGACLGGYYGWYNSNSLPIFTGLEAFKLGETTRTRPKDIFLAIIIPWFFVPLLSNATVLYFSYKLGLKRAAHWGVASDHHCFDAAKWVNSIESRHTWDSLFVNPGPSLYTMFFVGLILSVAIMFARTRWPGVILHPSGFLMGIAAPFWVVPFAIGLAIKLIILKVGGARMHNNILPPFAMGTLAAMGLIWILSIIFALTTQYPFGFVSW